MKHFAFMAAALICSAPAAAQGLPLNRAALAPMDSYFVMMVGDEQMGAMRYAASMEDGAFVVRDRTTMQPDIEETYVLRADAETFAPRALQISFAQGNQSQTVDLSWEEARARGRYVINDGSGGEPRTVEFDAETNGALARGSLFALARTLPLETGAVYVQPWFSGLSGQIETLRIMVGPAREVETPAGDFSAVPLVFADVSPENVVYVTPDADRRVVRIDVPAMNMRFLLTDEEGPPLPEAG